MPKGEGITSLWRPVRKSNLYEDRKGACQAPRVY